MNEHTHTVYVIQYSEIIVIVHFRTPCRYLYVVRRKDTEKYAPSSSLKKVHG